MRYLTLILAMVAMANASDEVLIRAARFVIQKNEGVRYQVYTDTNGHQTIGIGHKVKPGESFGIIDDTKVQELFAEDIREHLVRCRKTLSNFDSHPVQVRVAILDGFYRGCLSGSPKTLELMRQGRFLEASDEYLDNREYRRSRAAGTGVYKRMDRNAMVFRSYGKKLDE